MSTAALISVVVPAVGAGALFVFTFESLRGRFTTFFAPKFPGSENGRYPFKGFLRWIYEINRIEEEEVVSQCGLDAAVYLRFVRMGISAMAILTILGLVILGPAYSWDDPRMRFQLSFDLQALTLSNVGQGELTLWLPVITMWLSSVIICYFIQKNYKEIFNLRKLSFTRGDCAQYTILLTKIPSQYNTGSKIKQWIEPKFPGYSIYQVQPVRKVSGLKEEIDRLKREHLLRATASENHDSEKVKALSSNIEEIQKNIYLLKDQYESLDACGAAFVTFTSVAAAVQAANTPLTTGDTWEAQPAPLPDDVLWEAICRTPQSGTAREGIRALTVALITGMILLWAILLAAGGALSNLPELDSKYKWINGVERLPEGVKAIIEGFGPTVWRLLLMLLAKPLLRAICVGTVPLSNSTLERRFMTTYYIFLVVNIYFITLVSTSIILTIEEIIARPIDTLKVLGGEVPAVSFPMIHYIILQGLASQASAIARLDGLAIALFYIAIAGNAYERRDAAKPTRFEYGADLAAVCLIWTICMCYMTVSPLILPFGLAYLVIDFCVRKYNLLYVHVLHFETHGGFWPVLASTALNGLVLGQMALLVIIGLKQGYWEQLFLLPLPFLTSLFNHYTYMSGKPMLSPQPPLATAMELDKRRDPYEVKKLLQRSNELNLWKQPCMRVDIAHPLKDPPSIAYLGGQEGKLSSSLTSLMVDEKFVSYL